MKRLLPLLLALALQASPAQAENYYLLERGDQAYARGAYPEAIALYEQAYAQSPSYAQACRLAECYNLLRSYEKALSWSDRVVNGYSGQRSSFDELRNLQLLLYNGRYPEAEARLRRYSSLLPEDAAFVRACLDSARAWMKTPVAVKIENRVLYNTEGADFGLVANPRGGYALCSDAQWSIAPDQRTYEWTGRGHLQLYGSDGVKPMAPLLGASGSPAELNVGAPSFSPDGKEIFYAATVVQPEKFNLGGSGAPRPLHLGIYSRKLSSSGRWSAPIPFPHNNESEYSLGDPWLSQDGKTLYFVSDLPYGVGNTNIFYSERGKDGQWGPITEVAEGINTPYPERFPRTDSAGSFYFSSTGHPGLGGLDVFKVEVKNGRWGTPVNMGYPFNSPQDDYAPVFTRPEAGFLSSNRRGGLGEDDIYSFYFPPRGGVDTALSALLARSAPPLKAPEPEVVLGLTDVKAGGAAVKLENVYYDLDSWEVREDVAVELNTLVALLKKYPKMVIEVRSHTDARGTDKYNLTLSQMRAQAVARYLTSQGISPERVVPRGMGASLPAARCGPIRRCSEADHQANRRTEFLILKNE